MITAKLNGELINCYDGSIPDNILREYSSNGEILCPACGGKYEYCNGEFIAAYFRHKSKDECDKYSEPETEEHSTGKRKLYEWLSAQAGVTDAVLEGWIPETGQRPDILFKYGGRKYALEYQCTPIATEWVERTSLYESIGVKSIWVLGTKNYLWYQDPSGGKSTRVKSIEGKEPLYFDAALDIFLYGGSKERFGFRYSFKNDTVSDLLECILKWGVGTLSDKFSLICANLSMLKFDKRIISDTTKNKKYTRVLDRLFELKREIADLCRDCIEHSFPKSMFCWKKDSIDDLKLHGRWNGEFCSIRKNARGVSSSHTVKFTLWYSLCKDGMYWKTSLKLNDRVFATETMSTEALRTYVSITLPIRVRQLYRDAVDLSGGKFIATRRSVENYDPTRPYDYNECSILDYQTVEEQTN